MKNPVIITYRFIGVLVCFLFLSTLQSPVYAKDYVKSYAKNNGKNKAKESTLKPKPSLANLHYEQADNLNNKSNDDPSSKPSSKLRTSSDLPKPVQKLLKKYKIPQKNLSIYVRDLNKEKPLLEINADVLRSPASTMKLLTTYAALKELGPNYSWRTEVWLRGQLKQGVLKGDLILKGYGDPFLVYENFWKLVKTLRDKGLKEIQGDIIIDNSYFSLPDYNPAAFDGKPFRVYNAPASALMFNFQATRFLFKPVLNEADDNKADNEPEKKQQPLSSVDGVSKTGKEDKKRQKDKKKKRFKKHKVIGRVDIRPLPAIKGFDFENQVRLVKGKCRRLHYRPKFFRNKSGKLVIKGKYATKCKQKFILRTISTPEEHAFNAFRDFWLDLKGTLSGGLKIGKVHTGDVKFHTYSSPTLGQQLRLINKWSNNVMTRQLLLTLGAKRFGAPATLEKGQRAVLEILKENGIDTTGIKMENGSGLSRIAQLTARQMGSLLETAYRDAYMPEFMASLSLPGVDGTLVNRFRKEDLRGRSHLKTGTLNYVTAISGYMLNRFGKRLVVVIQHNGKKTGARRGEKIQNALLRWCFEQ